jgi:squalene cyclase
MRRSLCAALSAALLISFPAAASAKKSPREKKFDASVRRALDFLVREQRPQGYWEANRGQYRIAMTALAGMAMLCEGSTTNSGRYRDSIRKAVDYLSNAANPSTGLIGYKDDYRYTYGHGFSMLFLSQVYGDEEDPDRRKELKKILIRAVEFSVNAQTSRGGWGYKSAKEGNDFDEGSTCITQVQGLRACRNAGIPVPALAIKRAKKYIDDCRIKTGSQAGGIRYSYKSSNSPRPAISAAAVAVMFSTGEYKGPDVKQMLAYCRKYVWPNNSRNTSHWHYKHLYFAQVMYRLGDKEWKEYIADIGDQILKKQSANGSWGGNHVGVVYTTAINATILQLGKAYLPVYQR